MNVVLKLSKLCNLRCVYCYEYEHLAKTERMPLDGLERFVETLGHHYAVSGWNVELQFALHGGEPLLLPPAYLTSLVALQKKHLGARGIRFRNSVQTNLYRVPAETLRMLEELRIGIGVSLDVFGAQRVDARGRDSEERVRRNLVALVGSGLPRRLRVGGISVLHAGNVECAADTFGFFAGLGLDYRILPIFSMTEPPARMRHLMLEPEQVVAGFKAVFHAQLSAKGRKIRVHPIDDFLTAAVLHLSGHKAVVYDPGIMEWALIVDTNGDTYSHCGAYDPEYRLGNVFHEPVGKVLRSGTRRRLNDLRAERALICEACAFGSACSRIPLIEAVPSERVHDAAGILRCAVAQPMIEYIAGLITAVPAATAFLRRARSPAEPAVH